MTLRVGIIGFGGAGAAHRYYYTRVRETQVTKIFDTKEGGLKRAASLNLKDVEICSNLEDFWKNLDAISVCTPDSTHAKYIVQALERRLHVLCEKPLTDSFDGIRKIKAAEQKAGRVVAVLHQMRFVPVHRKMKDLIDAGELGTLSYLEGYYVHDIRIRDYLYDDWVTEERPTPLVRDGCHFVDLLRWLAGQEIEEVYAMSNNLSWPEAKDADLTAVMCRFAAGSIGKVLVAHAASTPQDHSVRLYGSEGSIENNVFFRKNVPWNIFHRPQIVQWEHVDLTTGVKDILRQLRNNLRHAFLGKQYEILSRFMRCRRDGEYSARFYPVRLYEHSTACIRAVRDFVDAVIQGKKPLCTVDESATTVLACLAGVESYRTGQPVRVKTLEEVCS